MDEFLLKAKPYQVFLSLMIPTFFAGFIPNINPEIPLIKAIFIVFPFVVWVYVLAKALNYCIPVRKRFSEGFLTFNLFFFCIVFVLVSMFLGGSVHFFGWAVLIPIYTIFSFFYLFYFVSKVLTSLEQGRRTSFGEHIGEMILFLIPILGVWYIQPRINKLSEIHDS